jgi:LysR family hydrogen peroxide-inducible transcriptional activator
VEIHQIRYFLMVAETLNFTKAAERCNVTQPALTRAVQKLEEELGGPLLRRERSLTRLTDLGRMMVPHLERVLDGSQAAKTTASGFLNLDKAPLRLGVMCTIGPQRCVGLLAHFNQRHPGVEIELHEAIPTRLLGELLEGRHDLAILALPEAIDGRFDAVPLYRERFVVALPPGHRLGDSPGVRMTDLDGERYLSRINCEYYDHLRDLRHSQGVTFVDAFRSEREDWIQSMILAGMGICFMPEYSPFYAGIRTRPIVEPEIVREVLLVSIAGRRFSPAMAAFMKVTKAYRWPADTEKRAGAPIGSLPP